MMHLRWRGRINLKDVTERVIAGLITGATMGVVFYALQTVLG